MTEPTIESLQVEIEQVLQQEVAPETLLTYSQCGSYGVRKGLKEIPPHVLAQVLNQLDAENKTLKAGIRNMRKTMNATDGVYSINFKYPWEDCDLDPFTKAEKL